MSLEMNTPSKYDDLIRVSGCDSYFPIGFSNWREMAGLTPTEIYRKFPFVEDIIRESKPDVLKLYKTHRIVEIDSEDVEEAIKRYLEKDFPNGVSEVKFVMSLVKKRGRILKVFNGAIAKVRG